MSTIDQRRAETPALVRQIMQTGVPVVTPECTLKDLIAIFKETGMDGLPVVEGGKLVGVVTEGDLMAPAADIRLPHYIELFDSIIYLSNIKKFEEQLQKAAAANVGQLMTHRREVRTVGPDEPASAAATLMLRHRFAQIPVIDPDDNLLGLVTRHAIIGLLAL